MRISDWSSDVCSSDLRRRDAGTGLCLRLFSISDARRLDGRLVGKPRPRPVDGRHQFGAVSRSRARGNGAAQLKWADAQATLYAPNQFLSWHQDIKDKEGWLVAYVLNFSRPDWGGYLNFLHKEDNNQDRKSDI